MFEFPKNTARVFKDITLQYKLEEDGFVVLPFYNKDEINQLAEFFLSNTSKDISGFQPTTYSQSLDYRLKASNFIKSIGIQHIDIFFENYKAFMGSFIVKYPDKNSELGIHQDMTLVDESHYMGINIWVPLCNTNDKNGALYLIPKSHRIFPSYRNATISNIYDNHHKIIKRYMQPIFLKAGEAIAFDNSLIHYSPANLSNEIRIATNIFITHIDAKITICYHDKLRNQIELFEQEEDFFTNYKQFGNDSNQLRPQLGKSIGFRDYNFPSISPEILIEKFGTLENKTFFGSLKKAIFG